MKTSTVALIGIAVVGGAILLRRGQTAPTLTESNVSAALASRRDQWVTMLMQGGISREAALARWQQIATTTQATLPGTAGLRGLGNYLGDSGDGLGSTLMVL